MSDLRDADGTRLLYIEEIAELAGWKVITVSNYASAGRRASRQRHGRKPEDFPAPARRVKRATRRSDGKPHVANTWVYREDRIRAYLAAKGITPQEVST